MQKLAIFTMILLNINLLVLLTASDSCNFVSLIMELACLLRFHNTICILLHLIKIDINLSYLIILNLTKYKAKQYNYTYHGTY